MQCELNINNTEEVIRENNLKKKIITKVVIENALFIFFSGFFISRVNLLLNQTDSRGIAPFGIAYLLASIMYRKKSNVLISAISVGVGYFTIRKSLSDVDMYLTLTGVITLYYFIASCLKKRRREIIGFMLVLAVFFSYGFYMEKYDVGVNITLSLVETLIVVPIYYVIRYALNSIKDFRTSYSFLTEEVISVSIFMCLVISGIGNITFMNYSIQKILALILVLAISYSGGAMHGSMIGICMGIIFGVTSDDMMKCIGFFGAGGLIVGIFKDTGKIFSILSGVIIYLALALYSNDLNVKFIVEVASACVIFLCIPKRIYKNLELEIIPENKENSMQLTQVNSIKDEFALKIRGLFSVLNNISKCLSMEEDNKNLLVKARASELVENLADRCCLNCENKCACWERNLNQTYNSFQLLIKSYEQGSISLPKELEKKCVKNFTLLRNTEAIVNNYELNETIKERLSQGRKILADHVSNITVMLDNLLNTLSSQFVVDTDSERKIKRELRKCSVEYKNIFCYLNLEGRLKIKVSLDSIISSGVDKKLESIISRAIRKNIKIIEESSVNLDHNERVITLQEPYRYNVISYGAKIPKDGEVQTGDSYIFETTQNGNYITILSDGMGSGPQAGIESMSTVDLVEKFIDSGFDENTTINTVNSIMGMKFSENEKYATLDMSKVDLYNGNITFVKIGAVSSFIKRGNDVQVINSKNLPFGLVDEVDIDPIKMQLKAGDIFISVSDGVLDIDRFNLNKFNWLEEYLKTINDDPKTMSEKILKKAKELSDKTIKDDMTVVVSKLYQAS